MSRFLILAGVVAVGMLLAGCMTYPYASSFAACDNAAGACHRGCADLVDEAAYRACAADCEYSADRCFAQAYEPYAYGGAYYSYGYGYGAPWYGSYGAWYPDAGYIFSFSYIDRHRYSRPHYGKRKPHNKRRDRDHDRKYAHDRDRHDERKRGRRYRDRSAYAGQDVGRRSDRFQPRSAEDTVRRTDDRLSTRRAPPSAAGPARQRRAPAGVSRATPPRPASPPAASSQPAAKPASPPPRADPPRARREAPASRSGSRRVKTAHEEVEPH
ncbi:hypothetical protein [Amphiplicatus metriothermophilus]|uniref:Uncharacterized protein n=1 Tax=Amphiplicatus metriothermophilus TaxID=1519374 RepID=A0A239Q0I6_9PROT|nr:hypothetical protein [Amphiplicatus metriothermophilus]MBB5520147.1 hypothetical protein [Amphiplicatus metriothermophilus]SNT75736.1 hypothetical protein SAMN06297382_2886 [Amphiplicatus metriothermophilus]